MKKELLPGLLLVLEVQHLPSSQKNISKKVVKFISCMGFKLMTEINKEVRFVSYDTGIHIHSCPVVRYKNLGEFYFFRVPHIWLTCHLFREQLAAFEIKSTYWSTSWETGHVKITNKLTRYNVVKFQFFLIEGQVGHLTYSPRWSLGKKNIDPWMKQK